MRALRDIHVGPAGWSYADWRGRVYPESAGSKFDTLALVAKYFDTAEINSSFYHPPAATTARSWLRRIEHNPNFVFTAKLYKVFTHQRDLATAADEKAFREEANVVERYDYLYSRDELEPWVERVKEVAQKAKQTFVVTNNHARGQSLVNAFEVLASLEEERVPGPAKLIETYPRLAESVKPDDEEQQGSLF